MDIALELATKAFLNKKGGQTGTESVEIRRALVSA
jgi:hypothetical protein